jgi:hydrogenase expression/formation protein HypE
MTRKLVGVLPDRIAMKHGAGGRSMRRLVEDVLLDRAWAAGAAMDDGAVLPIGDRWLVISTDSHVVQPRVFPGGDIGRLAVCGTVNDLAMMGATVPLGLTCAVVVEEGFDVDELQQVAASMRAACREAETVIVSGDTKVMRRGEVDGLIVNTTGVGLADRVIAAGSLRPGDVLIVTGTTGDHGVAVMAARHQIDLGGSLASDVAPLNGLIRQALDAGGDGIVALKDPTRGGLASALHELAAASGVGVVIAEDAVPVRPEVRATAELLGLDPLAIANEGKAVVGVRPAAAARVLAALRAHRLGADAAIIGRCIDEFVGSVVLDTGFGRRLLTEPDGELLPRIC